ncbi:hypothetical protein F511_30560 [Dorcoceras hygrometricum]|uniref:Uncharacterized protein n=1 Tax=Dorcoceras hygrometricum TaxID=472368 RepID=A0A2Z7BM83_9LAMI|nr:hypothetical protein F511_30560 [Dorcoceras hygrometricum]
MTSSYSADGLIEQSQESADSAGRLCVDNFSSRKLQLIQLQRKDFQTQCLSIQTQEDKSIVVEEDSGEANDEPDASNSSIQSSRLPSSLHTPPPPRVAGIRSGRFDEENPFVQNSSVLLVQPDEGVSVLVVDRIGDYLPQSTEKSRVLVIPELI